MILLMHHRKVAVVATSCCCLMVLFPAAVHGQHQAATPTHSFHQQFFHQPEHQLGSLSTWMGESSSFPYNDDDNELGDEEEYDHNEHSTLSRIAWYQNTTLARMKVHRRQRRKRRLQAKQQQEGFEVEDHHRALKVIVDGGVGAGTSYNSSIRKTAAAVATPLPRKIDARRIPKYVTELFIQPVLHDDRGRNSSHFEISLRQFYQQVLPNGYPKTLLWGYGDPSKPNSFRHPAGTVEVTHRKSTYITWRNELVVKPTVCRNSNYKSTTACRYVKHVLQDKYGKPIVDTSLHWAAPNRRCFNPKVNSTDCRGPNTPAANPYYGPVPMIPHVHGAHVEARSDGYPEAWFLPKASNIPKGYARNGRFFKSRYVPSSKIPEDGNRFVKDAGAGDKFFLAATRQARGQGYTVFRYTNDGPETTTLWYHDHTLGMTRLNVYAAGSGFWYIRTATDGDLRLAAKDAKGKPQKLPGPPARVGQDPNVLKGNVRKNIREVGLTIQDVDFYNNGNLFYPASRLYFDYPQCNDGTTLGTNGNTTLPYQPNSDVSPIWNPEAFFSTMTVNGNTFPKFTVAPERYRFKLLNACDSRTLNLALRVGNVFGTNAKELPFYVIGSDQGMLPQVVKVRTGYATKIVPGKSTPSTLKETKTQHRHSAMVMGPAERYDVIVSFTGLANGTVVYMINTGPDEPFGGFAGDEPGEEEEFEPADPFTTGQVMKFVVDYSMKKRGGDISTSPYNLVIKPEPKQSVTTPKKSRVRDLSIFEFESTKLCVLPPRSRDACKIPKVSCKAGDVDPLTGISSLTYGPTHANLGIRGRFGPGRLVSLRWMDPIHQNPLFGATEIWEFWNWTGDAHPLHVHLVSFRILGRYDMKGRKISDPLPYETGRKDTVVALPGQVTRIQLTFDIAGLYVWHCHILSHEDNDMMVPFCVGRKGLDCPAELF